VPTEMGMNDMNMMQSYPSNVTGVLEVISYVSNRGYVSIGTDAIDETHCPQTTEPALNNGLSLAG